MSLMDVDLEQLEAGSAYKFTATKLDKLGSAKYTLATMVVDASSSVLDFAPQLELMMKTIFKACNHDRNPTRDMLMIRATQFNDTLQELHGFKLLSNIKEDDYTGALSIGGMTALYDATDEAVQASAAYGKTLTSQDYTANAIIFVITDGQNNQGSIRVPDPVAKSIAAARKAENLESVIVVLIGVTNDDNNLDSYLLDFRDNGGIDQYVSLGKVTAGKLAKLAQFISQSISTTSVSLASGGPSKPLDPSTFNL